MKLGEFIDYLVNDFRDVNSEVICVTDNDVNLLYADEIRNLPDELLAAEVSTIALPDTAEDLNLTVSIDGYVSSDADDGSYEDIPE